MYTLFHLGIQWYFCLDYDYDEMYIGEFINCGVILPIIAVGICTAVFCLATKDD